MIREILPLPDGEITAVYLVPFYRAEVSLASGLLRLLARFRRAAAGVPGGGLGRGAGLARTDTGSTLAPEQSGGGAPGAHAEGRGADRRSGCGKSFTVRSIVALAAAKRARIMLAAPTGRAAKAPGGTGRACRP